MHEFSLVKKEVDHLKSKINGKKISKIVFSLGRLSHGTPQSITEAFQTIAADTPLSNVEFEVVSIDPRAKCLSCGEVLNSEVSNNMELTCIKCGSNSSEIISGEECYISSVEVEN